MTPFGTRLEAYRRRRGLQQQQLAAEVGINSCYISAMEKGRKGPPADEVLQAIINVLDLNNEEAGELRQAVHRSRKTIRLPESTATHEYELIYSLLERVGSITAEEAEAFLLFLKVNSGKRGGRYREAI